jgi:hypothetical protein
MTNIAKIAVELTKAERAAKSWRFLAYVFSIGFLYWLIDGTDELRIGVSAVLAFICWATSDIIHTLKEQ